MLLVLLGSTISWLWQNIFLLLYLVVTLGRMQETNKNVSNKIPCRSIYDSLSRWTNWFSCASRMTSRHSLCKLKWTIFTHTDDIACSSSPETVPMVTSTTRTRQVPQRFGVWIYDEHHSIWDAIRISEAWMASTFKIQEPTYQEAMSLPEAELWLQAMKSEVESLKVNKTWKLVALPTWCCATKSNWVLKVKYKPSGQLDKYNACLVAKWFLQIAGVDYSNTYSPVIKSDSMRTMFATIPHSNLHTRQFDICTTYLNSSLVEFIFMVQLEGFIDNEYPEFVCVLLWWLYGLKQGAHQWNRQFDTFCKKWSHPTRSRSLHL